ncbi:MAG: kelch repeat-containing protein [Vicinamibacterales bacterium]
MAYHAGRRQVVLFGGADEGAVRSDTWGWRAADRRWHRLAVDGPSPRTFAAMAYDSARGQIILFGGNRVLFGAGDEWQTVLGDTWVFDGERWQRRDAPGPAPRAEAAIAYDPRRDRIVLFGGYGRAADGRVRYGDTWEWDGREWRQVASDGPPPRNGGALAYDERRQVTALSGGPPSLVDPQTWEWDGAAWRAAAGPPPSARFNPVMTYHAGLGGLLRFGGWTGTARDSDTWVRDGGTWRQLTRSGPAARNHAAMAYDTARGVALLFGGHDGTAVFGDTWEFDGQDWRAVASTPPRRRVDNGH